MIIMSYPGVISEIKDPKYINLDIQLFYDQGKRICNYNVYCNIALLLSKQGYNVFVSSNKQIRKILSACDEEYILCIFPSIKLQDKWIKKLEDIYNNTGLDIDYTNLMNAKQYYYRDIKSLLSLSKIPKFKLVVIDDTLYNLKNIIYITTRPASMADHYFTKNKIEDWENKGHNLLHKKYHKKWDDFIYNYLCIYTETELKLALKISWLLQFQKREFIDCYRIFDEELPGIEAFDNVTNIISQFCDKGNEFVTYLEQSNKYRIEV